ncbi:hypothetical protein [Bacillus thuringiensis]|uniref:hypothetical protein n=1 Tax=Bacillus thuringiensis TaxID=1428 RepID=UPI000BFD20A9|nr:hypothetical protein [Bacillus thuringiensis]PGT89861.1 hypothetical protein COD17_08920 [Bacillus thuringiensis]
MALRNLVKPCLQITVRDRQIVGLKHVQTLPIDYIERHYGTIEALTKTLKGTILEGGEVKRVKTHDYADCFLV